MSLEVEQTDSVEDFVVLDQEQIVSDSKPIQAITADQHAADSLLNRIKNLEGLQIALEKRLKEIDAYKMLHAKKKLS